MSKEVKLKNGKTLIFDDGCFDEFEGTQKELNELREALIEAFGNMTEKDFDDAEKFIGEFPDVATRQ